MKNQIKFVTSKIPVRRHSAASQQGVTLIEALVSLFVFAVGALGVAALQTTAMVRGDDVKQRSVALWKAQELVDRIRATKTMADPDGQIAAYIAAVNNSNSDNGIGQFQTNGADEYSCPIADPIRCDDVFGTDAAACSVTEMVAFDLWSVMCDPNTGLVASAANGSTGLRNLEVALEQNGTEYRLYFEWLSRSANNNLDTEGVDTGLQNADTGVGRTVITNLCGDDENIDSRLDVYCVRFQ